MTTDKAAQSAWLATELMGYQQVQREDDKGPWWEKPGGEPVAQVAHWDPDYPVWAPFEIIAQAKLVQATMRAKGYRVQILSTFPEGDDIRYGVAFAQRGEGRPLTEASTEAAAICEDAGRALGWPFEEESND